MFVSPPALVQLSCRSDERKSLQTLTLQLCFWRKLERVLLLFSGELLKKNWNIWSFSCSNCRPETGMAAAPPMGNSSSLPSFGGVSIERWIDRREGQILTALGNNYATRRFSVCKASKQKSSRSFSFFSIFSSSSSRPASVSRRLVPADYRVEWWRVSDQAYSQRWVVKASTCTLSLIASMRRYRKIYEPPKIILQNSACRGKRSFICTCSPRARIRAGRRWGQNGEREFRNESTIWCIWRSLGIQNPICGRFPAVNLGVIWCKSSWRHPPSRVEKVRGGFTSARPLTTGHPCSSCVLAAPLEMPKNILFSSRAVENKIPNGSSLLMKQFRSGRSVGFRQVAQPGSVLINNIGRPIQDYANGLGQRRGERRQKACLLHFICMWGSALQGNLIGSTSASLRHAAG